MYDTQSAKDREELSVDEVRRRRQAAKRQLPRDRSDVQMQRAVAIGRMHEDRRARCAARVIGMAMGQDDPPNVRRRAAERSDRRVQPRQGATHAGVDDRDVVLEDRVCGGADERDRVDRGCDPRTR
jgi:hypothetical protein